jgi:hypothetical protein
LWAPRLGDPLLNQNAFRFQSLALLTQVAEFAGSQV